MSQINTAKAKETIDKGEISCLVEKVLSDSFPEFSTVSLLPLGLITGPRQFWKPKLLNVLVKEGLSLIHRETINRISKGKANLSGYLLIGLE